MLSDVIVRYVTCRKQVPSNSTAALLAYISRRPLRYAHLLSGRGRFIFRPCATVSL